MTHSGFFKIIVVVLIGVVILAYFNVDVKGYVESPKGQAIIENVNTTLSTIWNAFLKKPVLYVYNNMFMNVLLPTIQSWFDTSTTTPVSN